MFPIQHHAPLRPSIPIRLLLLRIHPKQKRIDRPIDPDLGVEDLIRIPGPEQRHRRGGERGFLCDFAQGGCEGGAVGGFDGAGAGGPEVLVDADVGAAFEDADAEGGVRGGPVLRKEEGTERWRVGAGAGGDMGGGGFGVGGEVVGGGSLDDPAARCLIVGVGVCSLSCCYAVVSAVTSCPSAILREGLKSKYS